MFLGHFDMIEFFEKIKALEINEVSKWLKYLGKFMETL